jgi:hypothetical protein
MEPHDWKQIKYFSEWEARITGASPHDLDFKMVGCYDAFRMLMNRPVIWLHNGLTTGNHKAKEHPLGQAGDSRFRPQDGEVDVQLVFKNALKAGFRGIGIYHNGKMYSFHFDIREDYAFWIGHKKPGESKWQYSSLIFDPANLTLI